MPARPGPAPVRPRRCVPAEDRSTAWGTVGVPAPPPRPTHGASCSPNSASLRRTSASVQAAQRWRCPGSKGVPQSAHLAAASGTVSRTNEEGGLHLVKRGIGEPVGLERGEYPTSWFSVAPGEVVAAQVLRYGLLHT